MRRDIRITNDIQIALFNMGLCRLVIPDVLPRRDNYMTGRIIALPEDIEICLAKIHSLEVRDWGTNHFVSIYNKNLIKEEKRRLGANSYILGDVPKSGKVIAVPMVFCCSKKAEEAIKMYCPF
jgi:hypothetical protein